jgi:phage host-nuclease inhibitor protein Gam
MKTRIKKTLTPLTREDAERALNRLRQFEINRQSALAQKSAEIARIDERWSDTLSTYETAILQETAVIHEWAEQNPTAFGKLKSITWPAGKFGFRTGTPKLAPLSRKWTWASILSVLCGLSKPWIRKTPEIDKEQILADYAKKSTTDAELAAYGLKVTQDESFFIEPDLETADPRQVTPAKEAA